MVDIEEPLIQEPPEKLEGETLGEEIPTKTAGTWPGVLDKYVLSQLIRGKSISGLQVVFAVILIAVCWIFIQDNDKGKLDNLQSALWTIEKSLLLSAIVLGLIGVYKTIEVFPNLRGRSQCIVIIIIIGLLLASYFIACSLVQFQNPILSNLRLVRLDVIRPFPSGEHFINKRDMDENLDRVVKKFDEHVKKGAPKCLVLVGKTDMQRLGANAMKRYGSNEDLARARADWVKSLLLKKDRQNIEERNISILVSGPTNELEASQEKLALDRSVEVYGCTSETNSIKQ